MRKTGTQAVDRALNLLSLIVADQGQSSITTLGRRIDLPIATSYRLVSALVRDGYLIPVGRGRHVPGTTLASLAALTSLNPALIAVGRPILKTLAKQLGCVVHLGVFDGNMVTYLLKAGRTAHGIFTAEGTQLEAYCSAIGKILLASLPPGELSTYLDEGPFVPLTSHTVTEPHRLNEALKVVRQEGYAQDMEEVATGLFCVAVAIYSPAGTAIAAISASRNRPPDTNDGLIESLRKAASKIETQIYGHPSTAGK